MHISRKSLVLLLCLVLSCTSLACGSANNSTNSVPATNVSSSNKQNQSQIPSGEYPVQQVTYNDANGEYDLMLLNTPSGVPPVFRTTDLQMVPLTEEEQKQGKQSYLEVENNQPVLHLSQDFRIEYVHNVTETQANPQTGQQEVVVVRQQSGFWAPFAGAALGNLLFTPQYYVPPVYQPGTNVITGYGGYGSSYQQAVNSYESRYNKPPAVVQNKQTKLRTTSNLKSPSTSTQKNNTTNTNTKTTSPNTNTSNTRSSGSGYGSSNLNNQKKSTTTNKKSTTRNKKKNSSSSFGSSRKSTSGSRRKKR